MMRRLQIAIATGLTLIAGLCHGTEHIEIVLDTSMEMWGAFSDGTTRIVAVRKAIDAFVASPVAGGEKFEFGLRTIGGHSDITVDSGCAASDSLIASGPVDPAQWSSALAGLDPRGGRALVYAVEQSVEDLSDQDGEKRIVIVTAGGDQCHRDISSLLERLSEAENPIAVRIIGLEMAQELANEMVLSTPTRNISDPNRLLDTLRWAAAPQTAASNRAEWLEFMVTLNEKPLDGATLYMVDRYLGEEASTSIVEGAAEMRLTPSRYRARIEGPEIGTIVLDDIVHLDSQDTLEVDLSPTPPVTLEVDPERPLAGSEAYIQYWGAPPGTNLVAITAAGAPVGQYLSRKPVTGADGEVRFSLPDSPNDLEVQFTHDIGSGIQQLLGRLEFTTSRRSVTVEVPDRVEFQTPMTLTWSGDGLPGDHIIIEYQGKDLREEVLCIPVVGYEPVTINAPEPAGDYVVRYRSRQGRSLARDNFEAFEILATLQGPTTAAPSEVINVAWTGPDTTQDFLSIATLDEAGEQYRRFAPTTNGNPAVLTAPVSPGEYEIRYVRGTDGEVLARQPLTVLEVEVTLEVPRVVDAGTRFEVAWSGTAGEGDFIAVAQAHSGPKNHLDWSYTDLGSPLTLAAPFDTGKYVVRYVSGTTGKILARRLIDVR